MAQFWARLDAGIRTLPPGAFAFVMATGIVSTAFLMVGWSVVSTVMLVLAEVSLAALAVALVVRLVRHPGSALSDAREPERAFGYFTIVAAINVVAVRLYPHDPRSMAGSPRYPGASSRMRARRPATSSRVRSPRCRWRPW